MTSLVFLVPILVGVTASPLHQQRETTTTTAPVPDNRLSGQNEGAFPPSSTSLAANDAKEDGKNVPRREYFARNVAPVLLNRYRRNEGKKNSNGEDEKDNDERFDAKERSNRKGKLSKKGRKHKAIFVDYPFVSQRLRQSYTSLPSYDIGYNDVVYDPNDYEVEERRGTSTAAGSKGKKYQEESNIFYIRLPPTPYMFVPGLGYISQPPTYSTASLRPPRPRPSYLSTQQQQQQQQTWNYHQRPNPFIKLPIDFVSNGKPTSVYHWQKKKPTTSNAGKLPPPPTLVDSPITNLDDLTPGFVSNGKPTTIYQWHTNLKPAKRPLDSNVDTLDKGPYVFNGKPTSLYLLKADGTGTDHRPIRYPDFENDNSYY